MNPNYGSTELMEKNAMENRPASAPVNILLVDDEERNLDVLESILASPDLRLVRATSPEVALLALVHEEFACIVLDIQMPTMSGLDLARLIKTRKRNQHIPIIFLTAYYLEEKDILQGYGVGAVDYLTKPINPRILKSKVGVFVDLFRTTRALAMANDALEQEITQRKKAEDALREANCELEGRVQVRTAELSLSEKRYREVVGSLPIAVYTTDADGRVMLFNDAAALLWGREPKIGRDVWCGSYKLYRPDGTPLPAEECPMAITLKTGRAVRGEEIVIERPDGTRRNVLPYPEPLFDVSGRLIGAVNMLMDVTEQKMSEAATRRLAAIVETSDDAIISKDINGVVTSWNESARRVFGYTAEEAIGKSITFLIPPERIGEEAEILKRIRSGGSVDHFETVRRRKDGSLIDISLTISPIRTADGRIIGASKIARDITDRKRDEQRQRVLYELVATVNRSSSVSEVCDAALAAIFQCQPANRAAILLFDDHGALRFKTWRGLSGQYRQAVEGHTPWKPDDTAPKPVFIQNAAAELEEPLRSTVGREGIGALAFFPINYEKRLLGKCMLYFNAPHQFSVEEIRPIQTIASQIAFAIERQRVLQELKRAHDDLLAALRAKDDFLATLSHELRTPLNPILLLASDAANNQALPPDVRADFHTVRKNAELEARLIDDLLDLTRIARGKIILDKHLLDLHGVLQDAIAQVREEMHQKQISLDLNLRAPLHTVYADAVRLQQIFWNLLKNAVKFTPARGHISLESALDGNTLAVKVADTGIGLTPEEIANIFNVFSQGEHAENGNGHRFGGLGLGLAISQRLAEIHLGKIYARSEGRNRGATFIVELPLARQEESRPVDPDTPAPPPAPKSNGIRILLVEDHEPTRTSLTRLLLRRDYEVLAAGSIAEARTLARTADFHLVISDIGLPDGNGCDLMAELKKNRPLKGIALTGYGMDSDVARSQNAGFDAHLTKPIRIQSLETVLDSLLQTPHAAASKTTSA